MGRSYQQVQHHLDCPGESGHRYRIYLLQRYRIYILRYVSNCRIFNLTCLGYFHREFFIKSNFNLVKIFILLDCIVCDKNQQIKFSEPRKSSRGNVYIIPMYGFYIDKVVIIHTRAVRIVPD